jgi:hypothetical protein
MSSAARRASDEHLALDFQPDHEAEHDHQPSLIQSRSAEGCDSHDRPRARRDRWLATDQAQSVR